VVWVAAGAERWPRLRNLAMAAAVAAAMILPVFWLNREGILNYYWVGHITGAESAARVRGFDLWHSVQFVFGNLGTIHLRAWFGGTVAALTGLLLLLLAVHPRKPAARPAPGWLFIGFAFLIVPAVILVFHRQKSEIVLGILVPGVVLLVLWLWHLLESRMELGTDRTGPRLLAVLPALAALGAGGYYFAAREFKSAHTPEFLQGARKINQLSDYIYHTARGAKLAEPNVGIDRIADFMDGRTLRVICYERHRTWVPFPVHLPDSILEGPDEVVLFKLKYCDFMILTDYMPDHGYWPYDKQMRRLYPALKAWCDENLVLVETFTAFERNMSFYQRRNLP